MEGLKDEAEGKWKKGKGMEWNGIEMRENWGLGMGMGMGSKSR